MIDIGRIVGVFGVRGRIKVQPLTHFTERFAVGETVWLKGEPRKIVWSAWHKTQARLELKGLDSIDEAEKLRGQSLQVPAAERPKLRAGEYYVGDLYGLEVISTEGRAIGKVTEIISGAAQDLIQVDRTILIPMVEQFVTEIDLNARRMTVRLIPGMLPGEDEPNE